jgi:hypothetical protein
MVTPGTGSLSADSAVEADCSPLSKTGTAKTHRRVLQGSDKKPTRTVRDQWKLSLIEGIILVTLGFLAVAVLMIGGLAVTILCG